MRQISLASRRVLERYRTRLMHTAAVASSIADSYASSGTVRPSGDSRITTSAPRPRWARKTCPSVGKSSSERTSFRRPPEKSMHDVIVDSASDTFVVMETSSGSAPTSAANVRFTDPIRGKTWPSHTGSGAPSLRHASRYSSR